MQDDDLIGMWKAIEVQPVPAAEILQMTKKRNQPFYKRARRQLIADALLCTLFLLLYYIFFYDGSTAFYAGLLLIGGLSLYIAHDLLVFSFYNQPQKGDSIPAMLRIYRNRLKIMTAITAILRGLAALVVIYVFSSAVRLDAAKVWMVRASALVLIGHWVVVVWIWLKKLGIVLVKLAKYHPINFLLGDDDGPSQGLEQWSRRK